MKNFGLMNKLLVAGAGATFVFATSPSQAAIIDITDFTGWEPIGNVSFNSDYQGVTLSSVGGVPDVDIESFLGLSNGALDTGNFQNATNGSAIRNTFAVEAGDVVRFNWQFQTSDYLPYNDFSFYSIGSSLEKLADVAQVGNFGSTSSQTSYTFSQAGTYTIGFGVVNSLDQVVNSNLSVGSKAVPEPITIISSLTAGAFGVALRFKKKQQDKTNSEA